ncbi:zinc finger CCCH domain-containing protein 3 isoform X3 [Coffea arabica]|uniref:Zinc finger CCCH domain-containing protein 3 isoform X3 n=1 Tax=Coffea arabica TaxID=13443 RepID=A0A6P6VZI5_COFAR|nr:zinc finger CCCH domain-containing protein 3 isoform X3 [Coffea arabica]
MPLGKYYCDYCDKEFQDTAAARKRHLQGVHHQRAKALWYDSLRSDVNQIPDPGTLGKQGVCNRFVRTGSCQYGDSCKYYHPKQNPNDQVLPGQMSSQNVQISWGNLPPSLMPPPEAGYPPLPFIDWG